MIIMVTVDAVGHFVSTGDSSLLRTLSGHLHFAGMMVLGMVMHRAVVIPIVVVTEDGAQFD